MKNEVKIDKYYVVDYTRDDHIEQLSIGLDTYEDALRFKNSDYRKTMHPDAFIMCTLTS